MKFVVNLLVVFVGLSIASAAELPLQCIPDGSDILVSFPMAEAAANSAYRQLRKELPMVTEGEIDMGRDFHVPFENIERMTMAGDLTRQPVCIIQTIKPVNLASIKANWEPSKYQAGKGFKLTDEVIGTTMVLRASYSSMRTDKDGKEMAYREPAGIMVLVNEHTLVFGQYFSEVAAEAVARRGVRPPELSKAMHNALADVSHAPATAFVYVCDPSKARRDWMNIERDFGFKLPGDATRTLISSISGLCLVAVPVGDTVQLSGRIICGSTKDAEAMQKLSAAVTVITSRLVEDMEVFPESLPASILAITPKREFSDVTAAASVPATSVTAWFRALVRMKDKEMEQWRAKKPQDSVPKVKG